MITYSEYLLRIRLEMKNKKIKQKDLVKLTGLANSTISNTLNGKSTSVDVINKIEEVLKGE